MYEIMDVQDISRPRCKRFVAHINVCTDDKDVIKTAILEATKEIRTTRKPTHVVRLYVHANGKLVCQSMWVDKTLQDVPLPKPLDYNDYVGDIGIVFIGRQN